MGIHPTASIRYRSCGILTSLHPSEEVALYHATSANVQQKSLKAAGHREGLQLTSYFDTAELGYAFAQPLGGESNWFPFQRRCFW